MRRDAPQGGARLGEKDARILFLICWLVYFCSYLGRLNYSSAMSQLIAQRLTKAEAGWINTAFFAAYAAGQLINGLLAEKRNPVAMVFVGALGAGVMNLLFAPMNSFPMMLVLRLLTGYFMSMLWPSILCILVRMMNREAIARATVDISSAMAAGTLASYLINAWLMKAFDWRITFVVPGVMLVLSAVIWLALFPQAGGSAREENASAPAAERDILPVVKLIALPALAAAVLPAILNGAVKDGVTAWVPTYIVEVFGKSASFSVLVSVLLPLVNLAGAYLAQYIYKLTRGSVFAGASIFFGVSAVCFALMLAARESLPLTLFFFALVSLAMMGVNVLMVNLFPLQFERYGRSATVSGGLNAIAYMGSALASGMIGEMSAAFGWNGTVFSWLGMMAAGFAVCLVVGGNGRGWAPAPRKGAPPP